MSGNVPCAILEPGNAGERTRHAVSLRRERSLSTLPLYTPLSQRPLLQIPAPSPWEREIAAFELADKKQLPQPGATLFIGSSSIRLWKTLSEDLPGINALNRGFGGSHISDSIQFVPRIVWPYAPSEIVFYAGTNDIESGKTPQRVLEDWQKFVARVRERLPATKFTFLSIVESPSRAKNLAKVREANALIKSWTIAQTGGRFIDVSTPLQGADGLPLPELFQADQLHLKPAGYEIWREVLKPILSR